MLDGYSTSLPLDYILGHDILLAYKMNGVDLPRARLPVPGGGRGPWGYKWAKWVNEIEVSNDMKYGLLGEARVQNDATLPGRTSCAGAGGRG